MSLPLSFPTILPRPVVDINSESTLTPMGNVLTSDPVAPKRRTVSIAAGISSVYRPFLATYPNVV